MSSSKRKPREEAPKVERAEDVAERPTPMRQVLMELVAGPTPIYDGVVDEQGYDPLPGT